MKIILPGDPVSQIRMKLSSRGKFAHLYDPRSKEKKDIVNQLSKKRQLIFQHPRVSFIFHMAIPKSVPKKLLPLYLSGLLKHEKKPDGDNLAKLYLDTMDQMFFEGDQKVSQGPAIKLYHPFPKTIIWLTETEQLLSEQEVDPQMWNFLTYSESCKQTCDEMDHLDDSLLPDQLISLQSDGTTGQPCVADSFDQ